MLVEKIKEEKRTLTPPDWLSNPVVSLEGSKMGKIKIVGGTLEIDFPVVDGVYKFEVQERTEIGKNGNGEIIGERYMVDAIKFKENMVSGSLNGEIKFKKKCEPEKNPKKPEQAFKIIEKLE